MKQLFYTLLALVLAPIAALMIFKPTVWQTFYSHLYFSRLEAKGNKTAKIIAKSLLSMISTESGQAAHRAVGIVLGIIVIYILLRKLGLQLTP